MHDPHVIEHVPELVEVFNDVAREDIRGTRLNDHFAAPEDGYETSSASNTLRFTLPNQIFRSILGVLDGKYKTTAYTQNPKNVSREAQHLKRLFHRGVSYGSARFLPRDSNVLFRQPNHKGHLVGQIQEIFECSYMEPNSEQATKKFLTIQTLKSLESEAGVALDCYRKFGLAGGFLSSSEKGAQYLVEISDVVCHFARTSMKIAGVDFVHVLPLNRVRPCKLSLDEAV
jgi:hypothetical protein